MRRSKRKTSSPYARVKPNKTGRNKATHYEEIEENPRDAVPVVQPETPMSSGTSLTTSETPEAEVVRQPITDELIKNKCDFETPGMCGFTDMSTGQFMWTRRKAGWTIGGQPLTDNTFNTKKDVSKEKNETELWYLSFLSGTWQKAEVGVPASTTKLHLIASSVLSYWNGGVAVDDVIISNEHCAGMHLLNCQFKDGNTCGYSNSTHDIAYWTLDQSTSLSNTDWFLKYNGNSFPAGGKARLVSPVMQSEGQRCFTLHYKLCKPYANYLSILMRYVFSGEKYFGSTLWTRSISDDNCTASGLEGPSMLLDHFIAIQVERYLIGDVYLDDLILYNENCLNCLT